MAFWLTVYCCDDISNLTAEQLLLGLRDGDSSAPAGVDYYTLAEGYDLEESDVDAAMSVLRTTTYGKAPIEVALHYAGEEDRPVLVHAWTEPARLAEELEECRDVREPPPDVEQILSNCKSIIGIELGASQLSTMGIVLAVELARYLAQKGDGVFVDDDNSWFAVHEGGFVQP